MTEPTRPGHTGSWLDPDPDELPPAPPPRRHTGGAEDTDMATKTARGAHRRSEDSEETPDTGGVEPAAATSWLDATSGIPPSARPRPTPLPSGAQTAASEAEAEAEAEADDNNDTVFPTTMTGAGKLHSDAADTTTTDINSGLSHNNITALVLPDSTGAASTALTIWQGGSGRLEQSIRLEEHGPSGVLGLAVAVLVALVCGLGLWAATVPVHERITVPGQILPVPAVARIQAPESGLIARLMVKEGESVEAEQLLLTLDPGDLVTQRDESARHLVALDLQARRLRALADGSEPDFTPPSPRFAELAQSQRDLFLADRLGLRQQRETQRAIIRERQMEIDVLKGHLETIERQLAAISDDSTRRGFAASRRLVASGMIDLFRIENQRNDLTNQLLRAEESLMDASRRLDDLDARHKADTLKDLGGIMAEIAHEKDTLVRVEARLARLDVRAPARGVIQALKPRTPGTSISANAVLAEIAAPDSELRLALTLPLDLARALREGQIVYVRPAEAPNAPGPSLAATLTRQVLATTSATAPSDGGGVTLSERWGTDGQTGGPSGVPIGARLNDPIAARALLPPESAVLVDIRAETRSLLTTLLSPVLGRQ